MFPALGVVPRRQLIRTHHDRLRSLTEAGLVQPE